MKTGAYYNENDQKTAAWLRELIKAKLIADGEVDTRSIVDVQPADVRGFVQCHFFAGIGGWSYALRLAGWRDDRAVWTGSCPCQPWSMAGEGQGTDDPRHLWPAWFRLIEVCRPSTIFGEQTGSLDGLYWLDLVYASMEAADYAIGTIDISGACLGSPDIRPRLWFVADSDRAQFSGQPHTGTEPLHGAMRIDPGRLEYTERERAGRSAGSEGRQERAAQGSREDERRWVVQAIDSSSVSRLADSEHTERRALDVAGQDGQQRQDARRKEAHGEPGTCREVRRLADSHGAGLAQRGSNRRVQRQTMGESEGEAAERRSLLGGFWSDAEWVWCRPEPRYPEGCWRPVEPGSFPLATGIPARILRLRGYGNSIKPTVAKEVIAAYMEIVG